MHDLTFAKEIISVIDARSKELGKGTAISGVNISLSIMSHVKPETLKETFAAMVKGTPLEKIALTITPQLLSMQCQSCKHTFKTNKPVTVCPACRSRNLNVLYSKEFSIDSVEIEKIEPK